MKITKYPQSCLFIETKGKKLLVDPGNINYKEEYLEIWNQADAILVTHKHPDHCHTEIIMQMNKPIYSSKEVADTYPELPIHIVKEGDNITIGEIKVEVVHAEHGFIPPMKNGNKVIENVGYIIDDGKNRLYTTSDTVCFENNYHCNILCAGISDFGITMGAFEVALFAKDVGANLVIPIHMDNPTYPINYIFVKDTFEKHGIEYEILENQETIEVE